MEEIDYPKALAQALNGTIKDQKKSNQRLYTLLLSTIIMLAITIVIMAGIILSYKKEIDKYTKYREESITKADLINLIESYELGDE